MCCEALGEFSWDLNILRLGLCTPVEQTLFMHVFQKQHS